ncbi:NmrA family NAD(P)-binding protein [Streptomyces lydicus]|uniref:NmrA family NAD(P)-binding protein n=1 Tax=Streptomyces lydicus TaxID=47763 RepID=UPI0037A92C1C
MVRDPDQPTARELADQGVEVVAGSLSDRGSLAAAMSGGVGCTPLQQTLLF